MARDDFGTDDFLLDQIDRTQQHRSRRRREGRFQQRRIIVIVTISLVALFIASAPSLVSHSPLGRTLVTRAAAQQGVALDAESIRVGWLTPLRLTGIQIHSRHAGNHFYIDQIDSGMTVTDLISGLGSELGEIAIRGVDVQCSVSEGMSSLEDDFADLLAPSESSEPRPRGFIAIQDISIAITDSHSGASWRIDQSSGDIELQPESINANFTGVLSEPNGNAGSLQGQFTRNDPIQPTDPAGQQWQMRFDTETVPLSVVSILRRRFPESASSIPLAVSGNTTGSIDVSGYNDGTIAAVINQLQVRHLQASDPNTGDRVWSNQAARFNGSLTLTPDRILGRNLQASTDFASATLDGSFARSMTLTGVNDNPLRWLDAIDGSASMQIDLAGLDEAMPGVLPLRQQTRIVSGTAVASIESVPDGTTRRSRLSLRSDPFRATAAGRAVVIEPIELTAIVQRAGDSLRAEQFQWKSAFGSVVGQGDLRSGAADLEIDFGRLASMLRPIIHISETQLDGLARGNIHWDATGDRIWRLSGTGTASNMQITLPGGKSIRQANLRGDISATGRWGNESLDELTEATVKLVSSGLDVQAELTQAVHHPSAESAIPFRVQSKGRLESLIATAGPWLPEQLHDADGDFTANVRGDVSTIAGRITNAAVELEQPRVAYAARSFTQPNVKLHFDGSWAWPSGDVDAKSFTLVGDALSAGIRGRINAEETDLEIAWRTKLQRIQGSVRRRVASRPATAFQQIAYRSSDSIETDDWIVMGDFDGTVRIQQQEQQIEIETHTTGADVAVVQPPQASAEAQTVGPMPRQTVSAQTGRFGQAAGPRTDNTLGNTTPASMRLSGNPIPSQARIVWSEPNLKVDTTFQYDLSSGQLSTKAMQIAGDWFATTLAGDATIKPTFRAAKLSGPARLKMDQVAARLSELTGTKIHAEGIQETPLDIQLSSDESGNFAFIVDGQLGWETGAFAGVYFGEATVPFRWTETSVSISPSVIPVGQGQLRLAGDVFYRPGPLWIRLEPGVVAESVRLTPEMTDRWLKYLAPLAADTARIDGTVSAEIDEAMIVIDDPQSLAHETMASRVSGRLNIEGVQMTAGPLTQQIISGVDQLKSLARAIPGQANPSDATDPTKLITMPPQSVEFLLDRGVVSHKRIYFEIDRAQLITGGQVGLDGQLDLVAQIPLDRRWLGADLQGLAGQGVSLPITGTLSRPRLDSSGVRQVVAQLATQTIQSAGDTFLKKQIERSEDYLGEQIGRGLDKLFGR